MAKKKRTLKQTITFIGEGDAEKAFLLYLKSLYGLGNPKVTPKSAGGKGPDNVIRDAIGSLSYSGCSIVAVLLDTDIPWPRQLVNDALKKGIILVKSDPCLEGLLCDILSITKSNSSPGCKSIIHPMLKGRETNRESYAALFTLDQLESARKSVNELDIIIKIIQGK